MPPRSSPFRDKEGLVAEIQNEQGRYLFNLDCFFPGL